MKEASGRMDLSIVIINFNGNALLRDCIISLKRHTAGLEYEIIVVDNGSTSENVDDALDGYTDIICVKNLRNIGFAAANNRGADHASGKYLLLLNNDTLLLENTLKILFEYCERSDTERIVGCKLLNADRTLQISTEYKDNILNTIGEKFYLGAVFKGSRALNKYYLNYFAAQEPVRTDAIKGAFMFMRTETFKRLGGFDEDFFFYGEEIDFCYRAVHNGIAIEYYPATAIIHLGGATTEKLPWFMFRNLHLAKMKMYRKHYGSAHRFTLTMLHYLGILLRVGVFSLLGVIKFSPSYFIRSGYFIKLLFIPPTR